MGIMRQPDAEEFLSHSDFNQIATFCLGWVFMISLNYLFSSSLFSTFCDRMSRFFGHFQSAGWGDAEILSTKSGSIIRRTQHQVLVFTLSLCFAFASLAYASSLLNFSPSRVGTAFCAFVVAFGGMASQVARLAGLTILVMELRRLQIVRWERLLQSACLFIGASLIIASNTVSFGVTVTVTELGKTLCYRRYFFATSLSFSLFYITLEIYVICRFLSFCAPSFLLLRHRLDCLQEPRILRGLSLLLLDLLTIIPGAIWFNTLAEFIPFSVGALTVLVAFNRDHNVNTDISIASIPPVTPETPSYGTSTRTVLSHMSTSIGARTYSRTVSRRADVSPTVETDVSDNDQPEGEFSRQSLTLHAIRHRPTMYSAISVESKSNKSPVEVRIGTPAPSQGRFLMVKTRPESGIELDRTAQSSPAPRTESSVHRERQVLSAPSTVAAGQTENQSEENDWRRASSPKTPHSDTEPLDAIQVDHNSNPASPIRDRRLTVESWSTFGRHTMASRSSVKVGLPFRRQLRPGQRPSAFGLSVTGPRPPPMAVVSPNRPSMRFEEDRTSSPRKT